MCEATYGLNGWGNDCLNPIVVEIYFPSHGVGNKDELYFTFGRFELHGRLVRLFVSGYKAHVPSRDADESGHVGVTFDCSRGPRRLVSY